MAQSGLPTAAEKSSAGSRGFLFIGGVFCSAA
jgi:hypothetical protein